MNNQMRRVYTTLSQEQAGIIEAARVRKIVEILGGRRPNDPDSFEKIKARRQQLIEKRQRA